MTPVYIRHYFFLRVNHHRKEYLNQKDTNHRLAILQQIKALKFYSSKTFAHWIYGVSVAIQAFLLCLGAALSDATEYVAGTASLFNLITEYTYFVHFYGSTLIIISFILR